MGEITISKKGGEYSLGIATKDFEEAELDENKSYEMIKAKKGIWLLLEKEKPKENPLDTKIFSLLKEKDLKDRVEEKFEKFLTKEELGRFKELLKQDKIVAFKLSPKYKKAVYKTKQEIENNTKPSNSKKESESNTAKEKAPEEYTLEKDGFLVCKNQNQAKALSIQLKEKIEKGEIRGIKGFDGMFYITEDQLYKKYKAKVLSAIQDEKGTNSAKIGEKTEISKVLAKIICELLKDEGEIIEKRKDQFQAI